MQVLLHLESFDSINLGHVCAHVLKEWERKKARKSVSPRRRHRGATFCRLSRLLSGKQTPHGAASSADRARLCIQRARNPSFSEDSLRKIVEPLN